MEGDQGESSRREPRGPRYSLGEGQDERVNVNVTGHS